MTVSRVMRRIRALIRRSAAERDLDDELRFHLDMEAQLAESSGVDPRQARRIAERRFGELEHVKDDCRDARRVSIIEDALRDSQLAVRMVRRSPAFSAAVILTLAIGIGATTAIFGAVRGILLRPLPYAEPDRIVTLWQHDLRSGGERDEVSLPNFADWRERARSFSALAASASFGLDLLGPDGPAYLPTSLVTEGYFEVFGVSPILGRSLQADDFVAGREKVIVLSHSAWRRHFASDSTIVGKSVILDEVPWIVAGVMPPSFRLPASTEVWAPKVPTEAEMRRRTSAFYTVAGRLRDGVTPDQARAEMAVISRQLATEHPQTNARTGVILVSLPELIVGSARRGLLVLLAGSVLVLLIGCANVANLFLARATVREREFAVRTAMGAGRGRLLRQLAAESFVLAALGGLAGMALATLAVFSIRAAAPSSLPRVGDIRLDGSVLAFGILLSMGTAAAFGFAPALHAVRSGGGAARDARGATAARSRVRARGALLVTQTALALVLVVGAGLLLRSFATLLAVDRGFDPANVFIMTAQSWSYYQRPDQRIRFVREVESALASLPGVTAVATTTSLPFLEPVGADRATPYDVDQPVPQTDQLPSVQAAAVTPRYFATLRIPLRSGRLTGDADDERAPKVAVVNETMARQLWPAGNPIGRRVSMRFGAPEAVYEVIGIVGDVRHDGLHEDPRPTIYVPHAQVPMGANVFLVRTSGEPQAIQRAAMSELWRVNGSIPIEHATTMDALLDNSLRERRFLLSLLTAFAAAALALAAVGIYGVISYLTAARTHEIGVRMALGAHTGDVLNLVLRQGAILAATGIVIGTLTAAGLSRVLGGMLYKVGPLDPLTFGAGVALLFATAAFASYLPARRASRLDPQIALRRE